MKHRDFVILVKGTEEINALVVFSHTVTTPATQTEPAFDTENLTVIYTNPVDGASWPSKDKILQNLQVEIGVPPVSAGKYFGWKDVPNLTRIASPEQVAAFDALSKSSGIDGDAGDWTKTVGEGKTDDTAAAKPEEAVNTSISGPDGLTDEQRGFKWGSPEHVAVLTKPEPEIVPAEDVVQADPEVVDAVAETNQETPVAAEPVPADPPAETPAA